jgi:hypothetical protein
MDSLNLQLEVSLGKPEPVKVLPKSDQEVKKPIRGAHTRKESKELFSSHKQDVEQRLIELAATSLP